MIKTTIKDSGSNLETHVAENNSLAVNIIEPDLRQRGEKNRYRYYSELLSNTAGVTNMNVNGSVTSQEFNSMAEDDNDIHVMSVVILLADLTVALNKFGALSALTNGFDLKIVEEGIDRPLINSAKTGGEILTQTAPIPFGVANAPNTITKYLSNSDALLMTIPLSQYVPNGYRLARGSKNRLVATVNDDLTGLDEFTIRLIGYRHFPLDPSPLTHG